MKFMQHKFKKAMRVGLAFSIVFSGFASYLFICAFASTPVNTENSTPVVRITAPLDKTRFKWNAMINYSISITDKEDGNSEYDEIPGNEVLLKVTYLTNSLHVKKYLAGNLNTGRDAAVSLLMKSNCFTCHSVKNKLIGPSFEAIAKRYPNNPASTELLIKKVTTGSSGVWGKPVMPPQREINKEQVKEMINWILKYSTDKNICYYTGLEGSFRTVEQPGKGVYILTASYTDRGLKNIPQSGKRGEHTIVLSPYSK
jgi:cytochrome c